MLKGLSAADSPSNNSPDGRGIGTAVIFLQKCRPTPPAPPIPINPTAAFIRLASAYQWSVLKRRCCPAEEGHLGFCACASGLVSAYRTAGSFDIRGTSRRRRRCCRGVQGSAGSPRYRQDAPFRNPASFRNIAPRFGTPPGVQGA